jgi:hypothetical protein
LRKDRDFFGQILAVSENFDYLCNLIPIPCRFIFTKQTSRKLGFQRTPQTFTPSAVNIHSGGHKYFRRPPKTHAVAYNSLLDSLQLPV